MVFPTSNLPTAAVPWGREVEKQLSTVTTTVKSNELNNAARDNQLASALTRLAAAQKKAEDAFTATGIVSGQVDALETEVTTLEGNVYFPGTTTINGGNIRTGTIGATQISSSYVYAGSISASQITTGSLSADRISAGTLTASNINLTSSSYSLKVGSSGEYSYLYVSPQNSQGISVNRIGFVGTSTAGWWTSTYPYFDNYGFVGLTSFAWAGIRSWTAVVVVSDEREKNSITDSDLGLSFIDSLRPVSYKYNVGENERVLDENGELVDTVPRAGKRKHYGLIAQDVKKVLDDANIDDFGGWVIDDINDPESRQALRYEEFISPLIKAVQELSARVKQLEGN